MHIGLYFRLLFLALVALLAFSLFVGFFLTSPLWLSLAWVYKLQIGVILLLLRFPPVGTFALWAFNVFFYAIIYENGSFHKFLYDLLIDLYPQKILLNMNYGYAAIDENDPYDDGVFLDNLTGEDEDEKYSL